jgi:hypothetical protein
MAQSPLMPPRDYSREVLALRAEEAVVVQTATVAMQQHIKDHKASGPLDQYYLSVSRHAPSFWRAIWFVNSADARGGAVEFVLDASGTKVLSVTHQE